MGTLVAGNFIVTHMASLMAAIIVAFIYWLL